ncbi:D-glycero-beta-D-manno-heptose 1,7-bisphosphate 7-phosphatase [Methylomarinum sp. Ch1-1]|uniref:D,D-heptose 1,7-bisphosphate phosphatase n=1 Tax=Methylomarinum roseum TaxID=3067653 RepID=A0AAU7NYY9_9GAMM|nr:D-glycero-beta-D-manno-heptose 1,7-bisphosphate 7-phosphatase [Methylomarinum sp. Ch1-1]MDP4522115.1 D-glycero-beta-D-manno-heptose 1,7-bisphosphate 7-phosphatase [Methylomarinum sp. Ch1-1]
MTPRYVLLDRDGVINYDSDQFIKSPQEWQPIPGSLEALALLNEHGYKVVVISNQSGVARGLFDEVALQNIHAKMQDLAADYGANIEAIYYCPHGPEDDCSCRKPKAGMLRQFSQDYQVSLTALPFIGDSLRDIEAAKAVSARPMLVKTGKGCKTLAANPDLNVPVFENLYDAAKFIVKEK